ncbi:MAG: hypothetical protein HOY79_39495, partial [Streptomyces sp.]|nr:hypothetical protein [Streptomyces sp.]
IVRWIEQQQSGQPEPDNPAPTLKLTPAAASGVSDVATTTTAKASDSTARTLGIAGLAVGVLGLITGGLGLARARAARQ